MPRSDYRQEAKVLLLAGNGFIGKQVARRLALQGYSVVIHHTGGRRIPEHPLIAEIRTPPTQLPIVEYSGALLGAKADVVIHFMSMGEADGSAFVRTFDGKAKRLVLISSSDVYRAYGRFIRSEPGAPDDTPLTETSPLRERLYPYRHKAAGADRLEYWYDKIFAERAIMAARQSAWTILRLPKVYGPDGNAKLGTVYDYADQPGWRWTHGHVENVAAAIALAATHPAGAGEIFNVGEAVTPTMADRLSGLPPGPPQSEKSGDYDFRQNMDVSSAKLRQELGYEDVVDETTAMKDLAKACLTPDGGA